MSSTRDPDTDTIIICALRYAFTRRSYMPSLVQEYIINHWQQIGVRRYIILQGIRDHIKEAEQLNLYKRGDEDILDSWKRTLHTLQTRNS